MWRMLISFFLCDLQPSKLNVYKNDNESWDYQNPNLGKFFIILLHLSSFLPILLFFCLDLNFVNLELLAYAQDKGWDKNWLYYECDFLCVILPTSPRN